MWQTSPEYTAMWDQRLAEARKVLADVERSVRLHCAGLPETVVFNGLLNEYLTAVPAENVAFIAAIATLDRVRPPVALPEV